MGISFKVPAAQDLTAITRTEAEAVARTLGEFVKLHEDAFYRFRKGALVLDGQMAEDIRACGGASIQNLGYAPARLVLELTLPAGEGAIGDHPTRGLAAGAIDALLDGEGLFEGFQGRYLDSGIYRPYAGSSAVGSLLVLNTTFGRFLAGASDDFQMNDPDGKYLFILLATAFSMGKIFPSDKTLSHSIAWLARTGPVHPYFVDQIQQEIHGIIQSSAGLSAYREYSNGARQHLPFRDYGDK